MDFVQAIKSCLGQYATFSGRASRSEFWWFFLFQVLVMAATSMLGDVINGIASLALLLPALAVGTRRLHDIGRTGFYPFDLVAAAYAVEPSLLRCAEVSAWIGRDAGLFGFFGVTGLFVDPVPDAEAKVTGRVSYCAETDGGMGAWLRERGM